MRRGRSLREYRSQNLRTKKILTLAERRKIAQDRLVDRKRKKVIIKGPPTEIVVLSDHLELSDDKPTLRHHANSRAEIRRRQRASMRQAINKGLRHKGPPRDYTTIPSHSPLSLNFLPFDSFVPTKHLKICHVIESLGLGGAQTMMAELVGGLNTYFGENTENYIVALSPKKQKPPGRLFASYNTSYLWIPNADFRQFLIDNRIDVVLHHRIAISKPLQKYLPEGVKYVLLNHTWNSINRIRDFMDCDAYVSVCSFLEDKTKWDQHIHDTRKLVVLNGIENNYIKDIEAKDITGGFKTGRCHRMVSAKFRADSLTWMNKRISKTIPGFHHHLIGTHKEAKAVANKYKWFTYHGTITDRNHKMGIIKQLDAYFYETFGDEGASIAVLEALASGVPVLASARGGTPELVLNGTNGFLCKDRTLFEIRLKQLASGKFPDLRDKTLIDFEERLHVRHTACKYVQLFEKLTDE